MVNSNNNSKPIVFSSWLEEAYMATDKEKLVKDMGIARGTFGERLEFFKDTGKIAGMVLILLPIAGVAIMVAQWDMGQILTSQGTALDQLGLTCFKDSETDLKVIKQCYRNLSSSVLFVVAFMVIQALLTTLILRKYELKRRFHK